MQCIADFCVKIEVQFPDTVMEWEDVHAPLVLQKVFCTLWLVATLQVKGPCTWVIDRCVC